MNGEAVWVWGLSHCEFRGPARRDFQHMEMGMEKGKVNLHVGLIVWQGDVPRKEPSRNKGGGY